MADVPAWFWWTVVAVSAVTFVVTVFDKVRARRGRSRVRERTLLGLAFLGGSMGLFVAMIVARHKVRKASFVAKFGLILGVQGLALFLWYAK